MLRHAPATSGTDRIVVTSAQVQTLVDAWTRTWQRPPTNEEREGLIEDYIKEEILYREALAMGLDRDDTVIRRRLRQKIEFLQDDASAAANPTDQELQAFLDAHLEKYRIEPKISFSHVYFNPDRRGGTLPRDIEKARSQLAAGRANPADLGDPFPLERDYDSLPVTDVVQIFGPYFAEKLSALEPGSWKGPVKSGYGEHLVLIRERIEGRRPMLGEVREAVDRDWRLARLTEVQDAFYKKLRERYTVTVEPLGASQKGQAEAGTR